MTRQEVFAYVKAQYHTDPDYPWKDENAVLRHKGNRKWYGLLMKVSSRKLGIAEEKTVDVLNVKCDPMLIAALRQKDGYFPAYHMNKEQWISILLEEQKRDEEIKNLLDFSYQLTRPKKK